MYSLRYLLAKHKSSVLLMSPIAMFVNKYWSQRSLSGLPIVTNIQFKQKFCFKRVYLVNDCKTFAQISNKSLQSKLQPDNSNDQDSDELDPYNFVVHLSVCLSGFSGEAKTGTGVTVRSDGLIVTNYHVVTDKSIVMITFSQSIKSSQLYDTNDHKDIADLYGLVIYREPQLDLAMIRIPSLKSTALVKGRLSTNMSVGQLADCYGYPSIGYSFGTGFIRAIHSLNPLLSGVRFSVDPDHMFINHSATTHRGFSGGPIVDIYGKVIGIHFSSGFCIANATHAKDVLDFIERCVEYETKDNIESFQYNKGLAVRLRQMDNGFEVMNAFSKDRLLANRNFTDNDVITHAKNIQLVCFSQLSDAIDVLLPKQTLSLTIETEFGDLDTDDIPLKPLTNCFIY